MQSLAPISATPVPETKANNGEADKMAKKLQEQGVENDPYEDLNW